jgi:cobalamin biosynthetic protein CobC
MLEHGGRLRAAAQQYGIALPDWLDLSTGLAPWPFAFPTVPASVWQRLPEDDDGLAAQAAQRYHAQSVLPVAGAQAAIQQLPQLRHAGSRVGLLTPCYAEHSQAWQRAGHQVLELQDDAVENALKGLDVLLLVNPNNPTCRVFAPQQLLDWHARLAARGGWLVVDEAFIDATPELSLAAHSHLPGLIVLRSFGKFYGLAGLRLGFVLAEPSLLNELHEGLGPWAVSGPARWVGAACGCSRPASAWLIYSPSMACRHTAVARCFNGCSRRRRLPCMSILLSAAFCYVTLANRRACVLACQPTRPIGSVCTQR